MTDKKLTNEEIIRRLKFCEDCSANINVEILDLINRQKAEIERLKKELTEYKLRLKMSECTVDETKSEAIKEFAERLKEKLQWDVEFENMIVFENDIDNLVKEMTEVQK